MRDRCADAKQSTLVRKQHIHKDINRHRTIERYGSNVSRSIDNIISERFIKRKN